MNKKWEASFYVVVYCQSKFFNLKVIYVHTFGQIVKNMTSQIWTSCNHCKKLNTIWMNITYALDLIKGKPPFITKIKVQKMQNMYTIVAICKK